MYKVTKLNPLSEIDTSCLFYKLRSAGYSRDALFKALKLSESQIPHAKRVIWDESSELDYETTSLLVQISNKALGTKYNWPKSVDTKALMEASIAERNSMTMVAEEFGISFASVKKLKDGESLQLKALVRFIQGATRILSQSILDKHFTYFTDEEILGIVINPMKVAGKISAMGLYKKRDVAKSLKIKDGARIELDARVNLLNTRAHREGMSFADQQREMKVIVSQVVGL